MSTEIVNVALSADTITLTAGAPSGQALIGNGTSFVATPPPAPTVGGGSLYASLPGGLLIQAGSVTLTSSSSPDPTVNFPISFNSFALVTVTGSASSGDTGYLTIVSWNLSSFVVHQNNTTGQICCWHAIGV